MASNFRSFQRNATRFNRLLVRLSKIVQEGTGSYGDYQAMQLVQVQMPPGQSVAPIQLLDYLGNVVFAIDQNGNIIKSAVTNVVNVKKQVALSAAQITTLHSAPVSLIAAPGAGVAINLESMVFNFKFGTTQFTGGGAVNPVYHGATTALLSGAIAQATIQGGVNATISAGARAAALALSSNTGVDLLASGGDFTGGGDSTATVTLEYDLITLS